MTDEEKTKLTKIIEKAEKNGFDFIKWHKNRTNIKGFPKEPLISLMLGSLEFYKLLLIDHDFAKAFFGEEFICEKCNTPLEKIDIKERWGGKNHIVNQWACLNCQLAPSPSYIPWIKHLQQAIISDIMLDYYYQKLE